MLQRSKRSKLYVLCMLVATLMLALVPVQSAMAASNIKLNLTSGALSGTVNTRYSVDLTDYTTNGTGALTYRVTSGNLPSGLSLTPSTGLISGVPTRAETKNITITVYDSSNSSYDWKGSITISSNWNNYDWDGYYYNGRYYNYYNNGKYYDYYNDGRYYNYYNDGRYYNYYNDGKYYNYCDDGKYYNYYNDGKYYNYYKDGRYYDYYYDGRYYTDRDRVWNSNHGHYHYNDICPNGWGVNRTTHMPSQSKAVNPVISAYTATAIKAGATLSVTAKSDRDLAQYYYWQYKDPTSGWTYINGAETATYNWSGLVPGKTYEVRAIVRNVDGGVATSPSITFTVPN